MVRLGLARIVWQLDTRIAPCTAHCTQAIQSAGQPTQHDKKNVLYTPFVCVCVCVLLLVIRPRGCTWDLFRFFRSRGSVCCRGRHGCACCGHDGMAWYGRSLWRMVGGRSVQVRLPIGTMSLSGRRTERTVCVKKLQSTNKASA